MAAGPVGSVWASGSWSATAWEAHTWADAAPPAPGDLLVIGDVTDLTPPVAVGLYLDSPIVWTVTPGVYLSAPDTTPLFIEERA